MDAGALIAIVCAEVLYLRAVRVLGGRGYDVPSWQQVSFHAGVILTAIGLLSPIDHLGEELLSAHMTQHVMIADLAAPLLLMGIRNPVLGFILPRPALILIDLSLPDCHGTEVVRQLKASAVTSDIPIIALSASVMASDKQRAASAGCAAFIEKPVMPDDVVALVRRLLAV